MSRWSSLLALAVVASLAALALALAAPPRPLDEQAPAGSFSAGRAFRHVEAIARAPRPPGTEAHREAEEYIVGELGSLGLETRVEEGWVVNRRGRRGVVVARVRNIVARRAGTGGGETVVLLSHYDSVPTGPGAGDDAAGVAAVLEAVRALGEGPPLANDVLVVVTDGEEGGLSGARRFVEEEAPAERIGVVLNFEARGDRGVVQMFQTSPDAAGMVRAMAAVSPAPWASSLSAEVYRRMPNDTDLTIFLDAGYAGMNFAMIGNHSAYHTELDRPEHLSLASLQHLGAHALALARHFGSVDLDALEAGEVVYFNPLGTRWLVVYSLTAARLLALLVVLLLAVALIRGFRSNRLESRSVRRGAIGWLLVVAACAGAALLLWTALERIFPAALAAPHGDPYGSDRLLLALVLACAGSAAAIGVAFAGSRPVGLAAGVALTWVLGSATLSVWVPGASYLFSWPALAATAGLVGALGCRDAVRLPIWLGLGPAVGLLLFAPAVAQAVEALQLSSWPVVGLAIGVPLTLCLPLLDGAVGGRLGVAAVPFLAGAGLFVWTGLGAAPTASTPAPTSLVYAYDAVEDRAVWMSYEERVDDWTGQVLPADTRPGPPPSFLPAAAGARRLVAPAPPIDLPAPRAELVEDVFEDDVRRLSLRVRSERGAPFLLLAPDPSLATIREVGLPERLVALDAGSDPVQILIENPPPQGVVVVLETFDRQPLELGLIDWSFGLPDLDDVELAARPPWLVRSTHWLSDGLLVHGSQWF